MKIIDLLNKIANGEEVPKKIEIIHTEYIYNDKEKEYQRYNEKLDLHYGLGEDRRLDLCLDDEVKILENEVLEEEKKTLNNIRESYGLPRIEEKKIPEKWNDLSFTTMRKKTDSIDDDIEKLKGYIETIMRTQNEIIDYLKSKGDE